MSDLEKESIFEIFWWGPYSLNEIKEEDKNYLNTLSLYAVYGDHPLYGRKVLTYIGKSINQRIDVRLSQHDLGNEEIYVAGILPFTNWKASYQLDQTEYDLKEYIIYRDHGLEIVINDTHSQIISNIEELLIYALWPAGNIRNKNSAKNSWSYRLFNTGHLGSLPPEVSGQYALENAPEPSESTP